MYINLAGNEGDEAKACRNGYYSRLLLQKITILI